MGRLRGGSHKIGGWLRGDFKMHGGDQIEETLKLQWGRLKRGGCMGASLCMPRPYLERLAQASERWRED